MSALVEISKRFIKSIETVMPELESRIVIFGQEFQEPKDGMPWIVLSMGETELSGFSGGMEKDFWNRHLNVIAHVYGRDIDTLSIAEELAFCPDKILFQQLFEENQIGVFCDRKIKNMTGIEGSTPNFRYDIELKLCFIGSGKPTFAGFADGGKIKGFTVERRRMRYA